MNEPELSDILYFKELIRVARTHEVEVISYNPLRMAIPLLTDNLIKFYEIAHLPNYLFPVMVCYLSHPKLDYIR